jgi:hypothetical protein
MVVVVGSAFARPGSPNTRGTSCGWQALSATWRHVSGTSRAVICTLPSYESALTSRQANSLLQRIGNLYARSDYGPRFGYSVAVPDHCTVHIGRLADCEIEFTRPAEAVPPCGQLFQMILGHLGKSAIDTRHRSNEIVVMPELKGLCHDPAVVNAML